MDIKNFLQKFLSISVIDANNFLQKLLSISGFDWKKKWRENLERGSRVHITLDAFINAKIHVKTIFQNGT